VKKRCASAKRRCPNANKRCANVKKRCAEKVETYNTEVPFFFFFLLLDFSSSFYAWRLGYSKLKECMRCVSQRSAPPTTITRLERILHHCSKILAQIQWFDCWWGSDGWGCCGSSWRSFQITNKFHLASSNTTSLYGFYLSLFFFFSSLSLSLSELGTGASLEVCWTRLALNNGDMKVCDSFSSLMFVRYVGLRKKERKFFVHASWFIQSIKFSPPVPESQKAPTI